MKIIYLDDIRTPISLDGVTHVKDYYEFVNLINMLFPNEFYDDTQVDLSISFDHDLVCFDDKGKEYTGHDCAVYLYEKGLIPFAIRIHSSNVWAPRIYSYLNNYATINKLTINRMEEIPFYIPKK